MTSALLIRLRPLGPWRYGPSNGGRDRVDLLFRSDRLFSAVTIALKRLDLLDQWLDATARADRPAVAFSSLFPFQGDTLFAPPPATLWPPPAGAIRMSSPVFQAKIRWRAAHFVPLNLVESLLLNQRILAEQWSVDADSGCLLRRDRPQSSPFRAVTRTQATVDRLSTAVEPHSLACVEFEPGSGLWAVAAFSDTAARDRWSGPLRAAFRLLADTGFGGRRSSGWGQTAAPEFQQGSWPGLVLPKLSRNGANSSSSEANGEPPAPAQHWLLSLFTPSVGDFIDWSGGRYALVTRGGRVESKEGHAPQKKLARFIEEGSVVASNNSPLGTAIDVAPDGFAHPVYRAGIALSVRLPLTNFAALSEETEAEAQQVTEPASAEMQTPAEDADVISDETQAPDESRSGAQTTVSAGEENTDSAANVESQTSSDAGENPPPQREPEEPSHGEREPDEDTPMPPVEEPGEQQPEGDPQPEEPPQQAAPQSDAQNSRASAMITEPAELTTHTPEETPHQPNGPSESERGHEL